MTQKVEIKIVPFAPEFVPTQGSDRSAGFDCRAAIDGSILLAKGTQRVIDLGFKVEIPQGWQMNLIPRSGLAAKKGITITNSPGLIDSDYRGPVMAIVANNGTGPLMIENLDRICQCTIQEVPETTFTTVEELSETERDAGGLGSTGVK